MFKSRRFSFYVAIAIGIMLIAGNRAMPVQANSTGIATTTPTTMPATQSSNQNVSASSVQQEEIKNIIQSYFELRYSALSTSQPDDFQLTSFGNLVSDQPDTKAFLGTELGKLAVDIKHARLNHLRYVNYKYSLDFKNISVEASSQTAVVSVAEGNEVIYEISKEHDPQNPVVSRTSGLDHTITLRQEQGQWKITSDYYNDYLWRVLRETGKSPSDMLDSVKASLPEPSLQSANAQAQVQCPNLPSGPTHAYDRTDAVTYALNHADSTKYNPEYPNYNGLGGDCTNFVSQALYEGGNASMAIPKPLPSPSPNGQSGWYLLNDTQRATDWDDVSGFYDFVTHPAVWDEGPEGCDVSIDKLMPGDVIQYWNGSTWNHSVIVVDFDAAGTPLVASHSPDVPETPYNSFAYFGSPAGTRFIHIEQSKGNPPAKAKISQGSDDAGTNPSAPCYFSSTDNEVYLGECFNNAGNITSGFRFNNIQIPQRAKIKYAYLTFTTDGTYNVPISVQLFGERSGNSLDFSAPNPQPENRSTTRANSAPIWTITGNLIDEWQLGMRRTAPDLSSDIEEIVGLPDWQPGHSLSIIIKNAGSTNVRRVIAFERASQDSSLSAAKIMIAYSTNGLPTPTPTPTATPTSTPMPPTPVPTIAPTIAPTLPPPPTPACTCYLNWFGGICLFSNAQHDFTVALHTLNNMTVDLTLFHRVENEILAKTPEGQRFINLYYTYSPEVIQLAQADPSIKTETQELIDLWSPNLQALVDGNGDQAVITAEQINAAKNFANHLSANASPELKQTITDILVQHPLDPMINKTMNEAWAYLNGYQLTWLPPVNTANPYTAQTGNTIPIEFTLTDFKGNFAVDNSVILKILDTNGNVVAGPIGVNSNPTQGITIQGTKYHYNFQTTGLADGLYTIQISYTSTNGQSAAYAIELATGKK